jgi:hypothetical protein
MGNLLLIVKVTHINIPADAKPNFAFSPLVNFVNDAVKAIFRGYFQIAIMITAVRPKEHKAQ